MCGGDDGVVCGGDCGGDDVWRGGRDVDVRVRGETRDVRVGRALSGV